MQNYELLDSGDLQKWERFGPFVLQRPCPQALWKREKQIIPDAIFSREGENRWTFVKRLPPNWTVEIHGIVMKIAPTDFGHVGIFPEHASLWDWIQKKVVKGGKVLNLFAYSGGASLAAAKAGAMVCHIDASKGMVQWARENSALNSLQEAPIRWIVEDAKKFLKREIKRGSQYDGIILDPPTFGRGSQGEVFKIEEELVPLLSLCKELSPRFVLLSCHTPGVTPTVLDHVVKQTMRCDACASELLLESPQILPIPCGSVAQIVCR